MLPILLGEAEIPEFIEDKIYVDLRIEYYSGLTRIAGMVHELSEYRIARAISDYLPESIKDIWRLLESMGFEPFVVLGGDDFDEILKHGGEKIREDYAHFFPSKLLDSAAVSDHVKTLMRELF